MTAPDGAYILTPAKAGRVDGRVAVAHYWTEPCWPTLEVLSWFEPWPDRLCFAVRVRGEHDFALAELERPARWVLESNAPSLEAAERYHRAEFRPWPRWCA